MESKNNHRMARNETKKVIAKAMKQEAEEVVQAVFRKEGRLRLHDG